jgi:hypothetical protein
MEESLGPSMSEMIQFTPNISSTVEKDETLKRLKATHD